MQTADLAIYIEERKSARGLLSQQQQQFQSRTPEKASAPFGHGTLKSAIEVLSLDKKCEFLQQRVKEYRAECSSLVEENQQLNILNKKLVNRLEELEKGELMSPRDTNWPIDLENKIEELATLAPEILSGSNAKPQTVLKRFVCSVQEFAFAEINNVKQRYFEMVHDL